MLVLISVDKKWRVNKGYDRRQQWRRRQRWQACVPHSHTSSSPGDGGAQQHQRSLAAINMLSLLSTSICLYTEVYPAVACLHCAVTLITSVSLQVTLRCSSASIHLPHPLLVGQV